eukprot:661735_1
MMTCGGPLPRRSNHRHKQTTPLQNHPDPQTDQKHASLRHIARDHPLFKTHLDSLNGACKCTPTYYTHHMNKPQTYYTHHTNKSPIFQPSSNPKPIATSPLICLQPNTLRHPVKKRYYGINNYSNHYCNLRNLFKEKIHVLQWNCDSILKKQSILIDFIKEFDGQHADEIKIILLQEPYKWYKVKEEMEEGIVWKSRQKAYQLPALEHYHGYSDYFGKSGVYIHKSIRHEHIADKPYSIEPGSIPHLEPKEYANQVFSTWIRIDTDHSHAKQLYIASYYRPPNRKNDPLSIRNDIKWIKHQNKTVHGTDCEWIIGGDLNATHVALGADADSTDYRQTLGQKLVDWIYDQNIHIANHAQPTHRNRASKRLSAIDWTLTSHGIDTSKWNWNAEETPWSDHFKITFTIGVKHQIETGSNWRWNINDNTNWDNWCAIADHELQQWRASFDDKIAQTKQLPQTIADITNDWVHKLIDTANIHIGKKWRSLSDLNYITHECRVASKNYNKFFNQYKKCRPSQITDALTNRKKSLKRNRDKAHRDAKLSYLENNFGTQTGGIPYWKAVKKVCSMNDQCGKDIGNLYDKKSGKLVAWDTEGRLKQFITLFTRWETDDNVRQHRIKNILSGYDTDDDDDINDDEKDPDYDRIVIDDEDDCIEEEEAVDEARNHAKFTRLFKDYLEKQKQKCNTNKKALEQLNKLITIHELKEALFSFNEGKALGPDELHWKFLTKGWAFLRIDLLRIVNLWFRHGCIPRSMKKFYVNPIKKGGKNRKYAESYRPIALTTILSRIFEKVLATRLLNYLVHGDLLSKHFGFIKAISTADATANLLDHIGRSFNQKNGYLHALFLDFSAAFDTVDRELLIAKLASEFGLNRPNPSDGYESEEEEEEGATLRSTASKLSRSSGGENLSGIEEEEGSALRSIAPGVTRPSGGENVCDSSDGYESEEEEEEGTALGSIESFLSDRAFAIKSNNYTTPWQTSTCGVPQGSPLSPILFLCYINGLSAIEHNGIKIQFYADDTVLYHNAAFTNLEQSEQQTIIQHAVDYISWYSNEHNLRLNNGKTQYIVFAKKKDRAELYLCIEMNGAPLVPVKESALYLGYTLDYNLSWSGHITKQLAKCKATFHRMRASMKHLWNINGEIIPHILETTILTKLFYGAELMGDVSRSAVEKWQKFMNKLMRFATGLEGKSARIIALQNLINWKDVYHIVKEKSATYFGALLRQSRSSPLSETIDSNWFKIWQKTAKKWNQFKADPLQDKISIDYDKYIDFHSDDVQDGDVFMKDWIAFKKKVKLNQNKKQYSPIWHAFKNAMICGGGDAKHVKDLKRYSDIPKQLSYHFPPLAAHHPNTEIELTYDETQFTDDYAFKHSEQYADELFIFTDGSVDKDERGGSGAIMIRSDAYLDAEYDESNEVYTPNWHAEHLATTFGYEDTTRTFQANPKIVHVSATPIAKRAAIDYCELMAILNNLQNAFNHYTTKYFDGFYLSHDAKIRPCDEHRLTYIVAPTFDLTAIRIISDSLNALNWLTNRWKPKEMRTYDLCVRIRAEIININKILEIPVIVQWTRSHTGTMGNDVADFFARCGVQKINKGFPFLHSYPHYINDNWTATSRRSDRNALIKSTNTVWQNHYHNELLKAKLKAEQKNNDSWWVSHKPEITKAFRKDFKILNRFQLKLVNEARTNRLWLNNLRMDRGDLHHSNCTNCDEGRQNRYDEDIQHYLLHCDAYAKHRTDLFKHMVDTHEDWDEWTDSMKLKIIFATDGTTEAHTNATMKLAAYLVDTKRFNKSRMHNEIRRRYIATPT